MVLLAHLLTTPAAAEIRIINGTGKPLVFDLLHAEKQERDVKLPVGGELSKVYGVPLERNKSEMLVVRDAEGKELLRESVQTDGAYSINNWGSGLIVNYLGRFQGPSSDATGLQLINGTGKTLEYKAEKADFSVRDGKSRDPKDMHAFELSTVPNMGKEGQAMKTSLSVVGIEPKPFDLVVGGLYMVTKQDKALVVTKVH